MRQRNKKYNLPQEYEQLRSDIRFETHFQISLHDSQVLTKLNVVHNILAQRPANSLGKFETHSLSALVHRDTVNDGVRSAEITVLEISGV